MNPFDSIGAQLAHILMGKRSGSSSSSSSSTPTSGVGPNLGLDESTQPKRPPSDTPTSTSTSGNPLMNALSAVQGQGMGNGPGSLSGAIARLMGNNPIDVGSATSTDQLSGGQATADNLSPTPTPTQPQLPRYSQPSAIPHESLPELRDSLLTGAGLPPDQYRSPETTRGVVKGNLSDEPLLGIETRDIPGDQGINEFYNSIRGQPSQTNGPKLNFLGDIVDRITGNTGPTITNNVKKNPFSGLPYPSSYDAQSASQYGIGNDSGNISGRASLIKKNVNGMYTNDIVDSVADTPSSSLADRPDVHDRLIRAELASHRNPIARLGFDVSTINIDPSQARRTIGGVYDNTVDQSYVNFSNSTGGTLIHESIHRGLTNLAKSNPEARKLINGIGSQEDIVRHIMAHEMGNTEKGLGSSSDKQIEQSDKLFSKSSTQEKYDTLIKLAAEEYKNRRPGGPR